MNIGEAAAAAGVSAKMVRHYERIGLLPPASRSDAGYRQYHEHEVEILRFVRRSRSLGFSIAQIGELLALRDDQGRSSRRVKALAQAHLAELEDKLRELEAMRRTLTALIAACAGDDRPHCGILEGLAQAAGEAQAPPVSRCCPTAAAAATSGRAARGRAGSGTARPSAPAPPPR
jgi:Cu(I)-responsive transcriptional regulator